MNGAPPRGALGAGAAAVLLLLAACSPGPASSPMADWRRKRAEAVGKGLTDWANISSNLMVEKYGPPDRVETLRLVWERRGPWKRIAVWDELDLLDDDRASRNLEVTVAYAVPADKRGALKSFSSGLSVSADGAELSARSAAEERNILLLNLADEILKGRMSPKDARSAYASTLALSEAGKTPPLMTRLQFQ